MNKYIYGITTASLLINVYQFIAIRHFATMTFENRVAVDNIIREMEVVNKLMKERGLA